MSYSDIVVQVENLSKCYQIYHRPKDRLKQSIYPRLQKMIGLRPISYFTQFWALKNVSFKIRKGETIGIIGRNGSGKSTLLQTICGILAPTSGWVKTVGRLSALLELGSGFNPEFTGRENIYMSGAIMGFTKEEIDSRFDEIVEFANIGSFIEQPCKMYSSGMYVRLAFAVSACVEPDILIIDEALAVGDVKFQTKCFRRFEDLLAKGTTILFVTHDLDQVTRHCTHGIVMDAGEIVLDATPKDAVSHYHDLIFGNDQANWRHEPTTNSPSNGPNHQNSTSIEKLESRIGYNSNEYRIGNRKAEIIDARIIVSDKKHTTILDTGDKIKLVMYAQFNQAIDKPLAGFQIKTPDGILIYGINSISYKTSKPTFQPAMPGELYRVIFSFTNNLTAGDYFISLGVSDYNGELIALDWRYDVVHINVSNKRSSPSGIIDLGTAVNMCRIDFSV